MADLNPVVVRTLNYLRGIHLPTYVALRLMLNKVPSSEMDNFVSSIISQVTIRKTSRVLDLKRFKSSLGSDYLYRHYSIPSPTSALADSYAISVVHECGASFRRKHVYSYRRPLDRGYPKSFEHFSLGYRQRNEDISRALDDDRMVAIVVDVKNFYPSVDAPKCLAALIERLNSKVVGERDRAIVLASAERAFSPVRDDGKVGLRVGPEMSHLLADISLEQVDSELVARFGGRYFRYVDDIVAVVPKGEASAARGIIGDALARAGHVVNPEKDCVVDGAAWSGCRDVARRLNSDASSSLNNLKFRAKLYLAKKPDDAGPLKIALAESGVHLPIDQLLDASRQKAWRYRVNSLFSQRWRVVTRHWGDSLTDIVVAARECKQHVVKDVAETLATGFSVAGCDISRKWRVQSARVSVNRALYFADSEMLEEIHRNVGDVPELAETSAVCMALLGDASRVLKMPGPAVAAFSQVASVRGVAFPSLAGLGEAIDSEILADVAAHFALRGGDAVIEREKLSSDLRGLTALASGAAIVPVPVSEIGYGAEVAALALNSSQSERVEAASTRFAMQEEVVLDALNLSANYVS